MRFAIPFTLVFLAPIAAQAQTKEIQDAVAARLGTLKYVASLHDEASGAFKPDAMGKPSLRATSAAVRAWKYLGGEKFGAKFPDKEKAATFVMSCYDPKTGGFADAPGGMADVFTTAVGVMAAVELDVPKEKFAKAMSFIRENVKSFEDARIGAAAVEAWGSTSSPFPLPDWRKLDEALAARSEPPAGEDPARKVGSVVAMTLRLGNPVPMPERQVELMEKGRRADGGWGKADEKTSDLESMYRVMRAFHMLKEKPKDVAKIREFLAKCRNADNGYGIAPGKPSGVGPVYYYAIITHWLDEMEKK
jgi:hypothetical protein